MRIDTWYHTPEDGWSTPLEGTTSETTAHALLVFGGSNYLERGELFEELQRHYPEAHLLGCSTAGEIHQDEIHDHRLLVTSIQLERSQMASTSRAISPGEDAADIGAELARQIKALQEDTPTLVMLFSDGLLINGDRLLHGVNTELDPRQTLVAGGLAGDGVAFQRTWVAHGSDVTTPKIVALAFYGEALEVSHSSRGGWGSFGPLRRVTRAESNVLYELDGQPALTLYKQYLGELAAELPAMALRFPLALCEEEEGPLIVRTVLSIDEEEQAMTFAGNIPQGSEVRLMMANVERLINAAEVAGDVLFDGVSPESEGPTLALAVSCVGRRIVLGAQTEEELEAVLELAPPHTTLVGFYSYGEIAPLSDDSGASILHNQTLTLSMLRER